MDVQLPEEVSPLQSATAAIQIQAEKLGHNEDWKSFKTDKGICKFYFDPELADKLMAAGQSGVVRDFIKAEISENNSFVANSNVKDLADKSPDIKEIYKQESISKSGWDWTNENENNEAFDQRKAITLGDADELTEKTPKQIKQAKVVNDSLDEFNDLFGNNSEERTPTIASLKKEDARQADFKRVNNDLDEFKELFSGKGDKVPTIESLKKEEQSKKISNNLEEFDELFKPYHEGKEPTPTLASLKSEKMKP